jgi:hypothetical protein
VSEPVVNLSIPGAEDKNSTAIYLLHMSSRRDAYLIKRMDNFAFIIRSSQRYITTDGQSTSLP